MSRRKRRTSARKHIKRVSGRHYGRKYNRKFWR